MKIKKFAPFFLIVFLFLISFILYLQIREKKFHIVKNQKKQVVENGINWLINQNDPAFQYLIVFYLRNIYQVTNDIELKKKLYKSIKEKEQSVFKKNYRLDWPDKNRINGHKLNDIVIELLRKRCLGENVDSDILTIKDILKNRLESLYSGKTTLTRKLIDAYFFDELGVSDKNYLPTIITKIRTKSQKITNPLSSDNWDYIYELTHIIFINSGYFESNPDPEEFRKEISLLKESLNIFSGRGQINDDEVDMLSEVISSLKVLRQKDNEITRQIYQKIIARQNKDGSWRNEDKKFYTVKVHTTGVALLSLLDYSDSFPKGKTYCPVKNT